MRVTKPNVAAVPVINTSGTISGVLFVADETPKAGLSAVKTYVLRSHAAQIAVCLYRERFRGREVVAERSRKLETQRLRRLESVVVNANDAILITNAEPINLPGPQIVYCNLPCPSSQSNGLHQNLEEVLGPRSAVSYNHGRHKGMQSTESNTRCS